MPTDRGAQRDTKGAKAGRRKGSCQLDGPTSEVRVLIRANGTTKSHPRIHCSAMGVEENGVDARAHSDTSEQQQGAELQNKDKASE